MKALSHVIVAVIAWIVGLAAYVAALRIRWQQSIFVGELFGIAKLSIIPWAITYAFICTPVLRRVGRWVTAPLRFWLLPILAVPLGSVAVLLVELALTGHLGLAGFGCSLPPTFLVSAVDILFC